MKNANIYRTGILFCLLTIVSCQHRSLPVTSGIGAESVTNEIPPATYLRIDNPQLAERLTISDVSHRVTNQLLEVNVELSSQYDKSMKLQYHFNWFDDHGFAVESGKSPWQPLELHGIQSTIIRGVAPSENATSFNVYVREAKSNAYQY